LDPLLREARAEAEADRDGPKLLRTSLALLPADSGQVSYLVQRLLNAEQDEVAVLRDALMPHKADLTERLWAVVERPGKDKQHQRLRAACALATFDPDSRRWEKVGAPIAADLVGVPAVYLASWVDALRPVRDQLLAPLQIIFRDRQRRETE